jgi:hypothetical protein
MPLFEDYDEKDYTRYFTSDNTPDGIENATHNTFAKQTASISRFAVQMYFGLHFPFRRTHEIHCMMQRLSKLFFIHVPRKVERKGESYIRWLTLSQLKMRSTSWRP